MKETIRGLIVEVLEKLEVAAQKEFSYGGEEAQEEI